ncbi:MAG TPA: excinuclease ABC subunit UvrC [Verrucomicrobiae bacterium]|nr:excinuclease ABC subunit UvrC [Verrucomicrobiae bacterium]
MPRPVTFDSRSFLQQLTTQPGVYRMYGAEDELLYVGKARNLKKRVAQYFLRASGSPRIEAMVNQIARIEVTVTHTEDEALVLEANLIKQFAPRYNVTLRDDKSYPYLMIAGDHPYPRITFHRGSRAAPHRYFGPYPSAAAVRETLLSLQKLFRLRPCSDSFFAHRTRPCLQHQINRCSAPCVRLVSEEDYARDLANARRLLEGKGEELATELSAAMERASAAQDYELAARNRDQIGALRRLQSDRIIAPDVRDADVIAVATHSACTCVTVLSVRDGHNLGHRSFFPAHATDVEPGPLLADFLGQYYLERKPPAEVLVPQAPDEAAWLEQGFSGRAGRKVEIYTPQRGAKVRLLEMAQLTADQALSAHLAANATMRARLDELQRVLSLDGPPQRMECFDISHTQGEGTVASCVVFNADGPLKSAYRRFNIAGVQPGDDYGAIRQAIGRRFARVKSGEVPAPDVLFIDGGKGQLGAALEALAELEFPALRVVAVAKGEGRRPGREQLFVPEQEASIVLPADSPGLHLIQRLRDEAHRFAITGHRGRRDKARVTSALEAIEGLGPSRRRSLLRELGGLGQVKRAGIDDLLRVTGINRALAERIYAHFH